MSSHKVFEGDVIVVSSLIHVRRKKQQQPIPMKVEQTSIDMLIALCRYGLFRCDAGCVDSIDQVYLVVRLRNEGVAEVVSVGRQNKAIKRLTQ